MIYENLEKSSMFEMKAKFEMKSAKKNQKSIQKSQKFVAKSYDRLDYQLKEIQDWTVQDISTLVDDKNEINGVRVTNLRVFNPDISVEN